MSKVSVSTQEPFLVSRRKQPLKQLNRIAKRPPIDIEFQDLTYSVPVSASKGGWRLLLKSVNGNFRSGQLTAIMGPSGAGKTTLLNILAGYVSEEAAEVLREILKEPSNKKYDFILWLFALTLRFYSPTVYDWLGKVQQYVLTSENCYTAGVKGSIKINDRPRDMKLFNKLSSYIMQEDLVQPRLNVRESMMIAASLKLGSSITQKDKIAVVDEVINLLGLQKCYDTRSEHLSGGQRRRLSVALELVNNPPVIFLDEPATGLDDVAIKQCMELLQKISRLERTVICTVHQPSASLFDNFDQVYVMANGYCVYNGAPSHLVPFMSAAGCICPSTSTPADFIIEIVQSNPENINVLQLHIQNGKCNMTDRTQKSKPLTVDSHELYEIYKDTTQSGIAYQDVTFPTSSLFQFQILLCRMFLQMRRNQSMLYIQFFHHLLSSLLVGGIFFGSGNDASQTISTFKYCISINVFFMYTYVMSPVILFPLEVKLLKREYFNRWYSLKAYYSALTVAGIPLLIVNSLMFLLIVYVLADQPLELNRFFWFVMMGVMVAMCSQGLGYAIGATFNILNGSVVGPHILAFLLALAVYGMGYKTGAEPFMKVLISTSYLRFGLIGFSGTLFNHRKPLNCEEIYCHYRNSKLLMIDMGMAGAEPPDQFFAIVGFMVFFRILSYLALKYSLTSELRNTIVNYAVKIARKE